MVAFLKICFLNLQNTFPVSNEREKRHLPTDTITIKKPVLNSRTLIMIFNNMQTQLYYIPILIVIPVCSQI